LNLSQQGQRSLNLSPQGVKLESTRMTIVSLDSKRSTIAKSPKLMKLSMKVNDGKEPKINKVNDGGQ
jgi:hypothetical protein